MLLQEAPQFPTQKLNGSCYRNSLFNASFKLHTMYTKSWHSNFIEYLSKENDSLSNVWISATNQVANMWHRLTCQIELCQNVMPSPTYLLVKHFHDDVMWWKRAIAMPRWCSSLFNLQWWKTKSEGKKDDEGMSDFDNWLIFSLSPSFGKAIIRGSCKRRENKAFFPSTQCEQLK